MLIKCIACFDKKNIGLGMYNFRCAQCNDTRFEFADNCVLECVECKAILKIESKQAFNMLHTKCNLSSMVTPTNTTWQILSIENNETKPTIESKKFTPLLLKRKKGTKNNAKN